MADLFDVSAETLELLADPNFVGNVERRQEDRRAEIDRDRARRLGL